MGQMAGRRVVRRGQRLGHSGGQPLRVVRRAGQGIGAGADGLVGPVPPCPAGGAKRLLHAARECSFCAAGPNGNDMTEKFASHSLSDLRRDAIAARFGRDADAHPRQHTAVEHLP